MHEHGKSDSSIAPKMFSNKSVPTLAERAEESELAKRNTFQQNRCRTQGRASLQNALERIRQAASRDKQQKFTSLWHHVYDINRPCPSGGVGYFQICEMWANFNYENYNRTTTIYAISAIYAILTTYVSVGICDICEKMTNLRNFTKPVLYR